MSVWFTPAAATWISTWPSSGFGVSTSSIRITSGLPVEWIRIAFTAMPSDAVPMGTTVEGAGIRCR